MNTLKNNEDYQNDDDRFSSLLDDQEDEPNNIVEESENIEPNVINEYQEDPGNTENPEDPEEETNDEDLISLYLKEYGSKDGKTIIYENEDGTTSDIDFQTLSNNEKLNVLKSISDIGLSKPEIDAVNYLRRNKTTLEATVNHFREEALSSFNKSKIDTYEYSDDELFILDLKKMYPTLSDDDLEVEFESAKSNESLYKRKLDAIKTNISTQKQLAIDSEKSRIEEEERSWVNNINSTLVNFDSFKFDYKDDKSDTISLDDDEKKYINEYIFKKEVDGKTKLEKALESPGELVELVAFKLYGKEIMSGMNSHWKEELSKNNKRKESQKPKSNKRDDSKRSNEKSLVVDTRSNIYDRLL